MSNASSSGAGSSQRRASSDPTIRRQLSRTGLATRILLGIAATLAVLGTAGSMLGRPAEASRVVDTAEADQPADELGTGEENGTAPSPRGSGAPQIPRLGLDGGGGRSTIPPAVPPTVAGDADDLPSAAPPEAPLLSPVARGLGISFIAAFAVGVFSRVFLRIAIAAVGVAVLLLLGLERGGFIEIHWTVLESQTGGLAGWLSAQTESMRAFLMGSLPSGAAAATGFVLGFRRR